MNFLGEGEVGPTPWKKHNALHFEIHPDPDLGQFSIFGSNWNSNFRPNGAP